LKSGELGDLLIKIFEGYSLREVVALSKGDSFKAFLVSKVGEKRFEELDRLDGTVWIDALRSLYLHYAKKQ